MPETLNSLEIQRSKILQQFLSLGDLRPGSISAVVHRCGKSYCHCAKPKDPGHEPQIRVLRKVHGKSVAETLSSPTAFRKAQGEVSEFHRFQELRCRARDPSQRKDLPPATPGAGGRGRECRGKNTAAAIHQEVARELDALLRVIFTARHKTGAMDLEAVEMALRAALQQAGAAGLSQLLRQEPPAEPHVPCSCGRSRPRLQGDAQQASAYRAGPRGKCGARLLLVLPLSARAILHRRGTGCGEHRALARSAPHVDAGGRV